MGAGPFFQVQRDGRFALRCAALTLCRPPSRLLLWRQQWAAGVRPPAVAMPARPPVVCLCAAAPPASLASSLEDQLAERLGLSPDAADPTGGGVFVLWGWRAGTACAPLQAARRQAPLHP